MITFLLLGTLFLLLLVVGGGLALIWKRRGQGDLDGDLYPIPRFVRDYALRSGTILRSLGRHPFGDQETRPAAERHSR